MSKDEDAALFAALAGDIRPIQSTARIARTAPKPKPKAAARTAISATLLPMDTITDDTLDSPSSWRVVRAGVSRERLRRLGKSRPDYQLDLHGKSRDQALQQLQQTIVIARQNHGRIIEIIHGRGLHSSGGVAILRQAVYHWLSHGPYHTSVLAVIPKPNSGGGACMLLLRRH